MELKGYPINNPQNQKCTKGVCPIGKIEMKPEICIYSLPSHSRDRDTYEKLGGYIMLCDYPNVFNKTHPIESLLEKQNDRPDKDGEIIA